MDVEYELLPYYMKATIITPIVNYKHIIRSMYIDYYIISQSNAIIEILSWVICCWKQNLNV